MTIEEALSKFLIQLQADGRSPHTIGQYRRHIRLLARWARDVGRFGDEIERLGHEAIAQFLASPLARDRAGGGTKKATSANCLRTSIRCFLGYCHRAGVTTSDAGRLIRRARCSPPPPRSMSEEDQHRLFETLKRTEDPHARRDEMLFRLLAATGIRIGSAVALDVEDIDLARSQINIRRAKNDAPDVVYLNDAIKTHLERFLMGHPNGPLFLANGARVSTRHAERRFSQWIRAAGITSKVSCHSLRHGFGMRFYEKTRDLALTQAAMHHRNVASTMIYLRVDERRLREAL